jgi:hypothetical protein
MKLKGQKNEERRGQRKNKQISSKCADKKKETKKLKICTYKF